MTIDEINQGCLMWFTIAFLHKPDEKSCKDSAEQILDWAEIHTPEVCVNRVVNGEYGRHLLTIPKSQLFWMHLGMAFYLACRDLTKV